MSNNSQRTKSMKNYFNVTNTHTTCQMKRLGISAVNDMWDFVLCSRKSFESLIMWIDEISIVSHSTLFLNDFICFIINFIPSWLVSNFKTFLKHTWMWNSYFSCKIYQLWSIFTLKFHYFKTLSTTVEKWMHALQCYHNNAVNFHDTQHELEIMHL